MKKLIPILIILSLALSACGNFPIKPGNEDADDAAMATRVAELLSTMTTPTSAIETQPTATAISATQAPQEPTAELTAAPTSETPQEQAPTATAEPEGATPEAETTPTETAMPTPVLPDTDPVRGLGTPTGTDPFDSYKQWTWPTDSDDFVKIDFKDGYLQMTGLSSKAGWRLPLLPQQTNAYIELTVNSGACQSKDAYGIIFRVPVFKEPNQGYLYEVTCDGYLRLWEWDGKAKPNGKAEILINWKASEDINTGANQVNRLGVMTVGNTLKLYINGVPQGEVSDSTFTAGFFGTFVRSVTSSRYVVKFDEMKYWENPTR